LYWIRAYYWWLLRKYIPLVERHKYLSIPVYVAARVAFNLVLGLLLVVDAARLFLRRLL
jgi:predicted KAP-like P-loop ATPase